MKGISGKHSSVCWFLLWNRLDSKKKGLHYFWPFKIHCRSTARLSPSLLQTHDMSIGHIEWSSSYWVCSLSVPTWCLGWTNQFSLICEEAGEALSLSMKWHYALWTEQLSNGDRAPDEEETLRQRAEIWTQERLYMKSDWWCWTKKRQQKEWLE